MIAVRPLPPRRTRARVLVALAGVASIAIAIAISAAGRPASAGGPPPSALVQAREGFTTHLTVDANSGKPAPVPPTGVLDVVTYPSAVGDLVAYLTPDPGDGRKHPAIIWIVGGDNNSIDDVWTRQPAKNDQSASAFRESGIVTMYPSQRGGNTNPGRKEGFLGECDDILAAARFLAAQPFVDPNRIFLGGHSTGGTLALLVAELPNPFRAVFALGPVANPVVYDDPMSTPFDTDDREEVVVRAPGAWLESVQGPTWVAEGTKEPSNIASLRLMARLPHAPRLKFVPLKGRDHFTEVRPATVRLAQDIVADDGQGTFTTRLH